MSRENKWDRKKMGYLKSKGERVPRTTFINQNKLRGQRMVHKPLVEETDWVAVIRRHVQLKTGYN